MAVQIQLRRDTASNWTSANPTLAAGEFAIETDTDKYKIGDGSTAWTSLGYSSLPSNVLPLAGGAMTGAITTNSTFDGVDIATRDAVLTSTTTTASAALPKAGGTLTGAVTGTDATFTGTTTTYVDVVEETGASHTFALSDAGKYIHCTGAAGNVTITMPSDSTTAFPIGTQMLFSCPHASNKITFAAGSSAAVTSLDDKLTLKGPDGVAAVLKWTTNSWLLFGPLE